MTGNKKQLYDFYKECLDSGYTSFDNAYQKQKIQLLAKKHGIVSSLDDFQYDSLLNAKNEYNNYLSEQNKQKQKKEDSEHEMYVNQLRAEESEIVKVVKTYSNLKGREKISSMCNAIINANQYILNSIKKQERKEYREKRSIVIPSAIVGGTIEGLTGSRLAGVYNALNNEEVNEAKRARNAELANDISRKYYSDKIDAESLVNRAKRVLKNTELSYIDTEKLLARNIVINDLKLFISDTGALRIFARLSMTKIQGLPNDIRAYIDGTMKALIINKRTQEIAEEVLMTLGFEGLGSSTNIEGVNPNTKITIDNIDDYECELVDYNLFAVEDSRATFNAYPPRVYIKQAAIDYYYNKAYSLYSQKTIDALQEAKKYALYIINEQKAADLAKEIDREIADQYKLIADNALNSNDSKIISDAIGQLSESTNDSKNEEAIESLKLKLEYVNEQDRIQGEKNYKKAKKNSVIIGAIISLSAIAFGIYMLVIYPNNLYEKALLAYSNNDYKTALEYFEKIENHKDSKEYINELSKHVIIEQILHEGISDLDVSTIDKDYVDKNTEKTYDAAVKLVESSEYNKASQLLSLCGNYKDAEKIINYCSGKEAYLANDKKKAIDFFAKSKGIFDSDELIDLICDETIKEGNLSLADLLDVFDLSELMRSKYSDIYEMALDLINYEGMWEAYKYSKNTKNGRSYYTRNGSNYTVYLSFILLDSGYFECFAGKESLRTVHKISEYKKPDTLQLAEYYQFKYYASSLKMIVFGEGDKAIYSDTYYGPDSQDYISVTLYMKKQ